jgi:hypothetical protein
MVGKFTGLTGSPHGLFGAFTTRFSSSNAAKLYNMTLADQLYLKEDEWQFGMKLRPDHIWDAFIISALLDDHLTQGTTLDVPHTGDQDDRYKVAMEARNRRIILEGQPDAVQHACDKCMRVFQLDGEYRSHLLYKSCKEQLN